MRRRTHSALWGLAFLRPLALAPCAASAVAPARAEPLDERPQPAGSSAAKPGPRLAFFGGDSAHNFSNPGGHLGLEYPLWTSPRFQSIAASSFHVYHQTDTQTGYALQARWGQRYTASFGLSVESFLGVGVQVTHYDTTSFEFSEGVAIEKEGGKTRVALAPHVVFGPGYDFEPLLGVPIHTYVRPGVQLVYPDLNLAFQVAGTLELGVRWTFD